MGNKYVRARWIPLDLDGGENKLDHQITIDLLMDAETQMFTGKQFCMGLYGSPARTNCYPFMIKFDGTVDYGEFCESNEERLHKFNGLLRPIKIGEVASYDDNDLGWVMRLDTIQDLC